MYWVTLPFLGHDAADAQRELARRPPAQATA
jgi:hypothetical protein